MTSRVWENIEIAISPLWKGVERWLTPHWNGNFTENTMGQVMTLESRLGK